ncbi:hypothetical protein WQ59_27875 [Streptomyces sp. KE1]|nr:hypothetical protein WQ59_27875 [Streptomyces sp. KE1]
MNPGFRIHLSGYRTLRRAAPQTPIRPSPPACPFSPAAEKPRPLPIGAHESNCDTAARNAGVHFPGVTLGNLRAIRRPEIRLPRQDRNAPFADHSRAARPNSPPPQGGHPAHSARSHHPDKRKGGFFPLPPSPALSALRPRHNKRVTSLA